MAQAAMENVRLEETMPGLAVGAAAHFHALGERAATGVHRRRSTDGGTRLGASASSSADATMSDAIELSNMSRSAEPSLMDIESTSEESRSSTSSSGSNAPMVSSAERNVQRRRARLCFAAMCWCFFLAGWNDGSTGPLLPTIQRHYNISFAVVSLLFVFNTLGYLLGSCANVYLSDKLGLGKVIVLGASCQLAAYAMLSPAGPFPVMCIAFCLAGFGLSLQTALANGFVGSLRHSATKLGILHAVYGFGALSAPLVATQFAARQRWSFHYLTSLGMAVANVAFLCAVFRFKTQDAVMAEAGEAPSEANTGGGSKYRQIMRLPAVHFLAIWTLIYVGVEVTLGGWIVTFVQQKRGGGASTGYISSGFFGGLMLGRVLLLWLNRKIGERRVMFIYTFLAIQLEVTIWVVPSLIENALAVSCIGLLLGPMYPILVNHSKRILPRWLFTSSVGWIAGVGQSGSAILPFATGLLATKFGITSLQPFIVSMMSAMVVIWAFVPRMRRVE